MYVVLKKINAIKARFGHGGTVSMDARIRVTAVFLPIRGETEWRRKDLFKGRVFAIPSNLKDRVLLGKFMLSRVQVDQVLGGSRNREILGGKGWDCGCGGVLWCVALTHCLCRHQCLICLWGEETTFCPEQGHRGIFYVTLLKMQGPRSPPLRICFTTHCSLSLN